MALTDLTGASYGPYPYRTCAEKVAEYVDATADDPGRWVDHAPPGMAGAALFVVAPHLLSDPRIASRARSVIHGDQTFTWHAAIPAEADLTVTGTVARVRERSGVAFVGFGMTLAAGDRILVEGSSTFLMSGEAPPAGDGEERTEPAPELAGDLDPLGELGEPSEGEELPPLRRSASRAGLVRYAGASRDWNPIHWDHSAAVAAGLPGVVAHGLLQAAWILQAAARHRPGPAPVASARFRFRAPLLPGVPVRVEGSATAPDALDLALRDDDTTYVAASVALGGGSG